MEYAVSAAANVCLMIMCMTVAYM